MPLRLQTREGVESGGTLVFVDIDKQTIVRHVGFPTHVACMTWHHRLNQILVGIGKLQQWILCVVWCWTTLALVMIKHMLAVGTPYSRPVPLFQPFTSVACTRSKTCYRAE